MTPPLGCFLCPTAAFVKLHDVIDAFAPLPRGHLNRWREELFSQREKEALGSFAASVCRRSPRWSDPRNPGFAHALKTSTSRSEVAMGVEVRGVMRRPFPDTSKNIRKRELRRRSLTAPVLVARCSPHAGSISHIIEEDFHHLPANLGCKHTEAIELRPLLLQAWF